MSGTTSLGRCAGLARPVVPMPFTLKISAKSARPKLCPSSARLTADGYDRLTWAEAEGKWCRDDGQKLLHRALGAFLHGL